MPKLKLFRRNRGQPKQTDEGHNSATISDPGQSYRSTSFFDLPAEIRNHVYTFVARDLTLRLLPHACHARSRSFATKTFAQNPVPGLLLASHRTRKESLPIILAVATIYTSVGPDYDFTSLIRYIRSCYRSELHAMRANPHLLIILPLPPPSKQLAVDLQIHLVNLRRWTTFRADALDRLPWSYRLATATDSEEFQERRLSGLDRLYRIHALLEESSRWELHRMIEMFVTSDGRSELCAD